MYIAKNDSKDVAGSLQVNAAQEAGTKAAIHAIYDVFVNRMKLKLSLY